ncbi:unnamed protein product [Schistocephalus solidus]|uniref:PH domain-containing protein n=1 Tax=Schistocephalus solidus TaxID=70667 RepID=A0A183TA95_SCHSO|nr:unnamed protein product [Schistocephalus solidus]
MDKHTSVFRVLAAIQSAQSAVAPCSADTNLFYLHADWAVQGRLLLSPCALRRHRSARLVDVLTPHCSIVMQTGKSHARADTPRNTTWAAMIVGKMRVMQRTDILRSVRLPPRVETTELHSGWLKKQGGTFRTWRRRFFVLDGSGRLAYYTTEDKLHYSGFFSLAEGPITVSSYESETGNAAVDRTYNFSLKRYDQRRTCLAFPILLRFLSVIWIAPTDLHSDTSAVGWRPRRADELVKLESRIPAPPTFNFYHYVLAVTFVGYSRKTKLYSSVDAEAEFSPLDSVAGHKRSRWTRGLSSSSARRGAKKVGEAEEFPRRHTFSYEVQDDLSSPARKTYAPNFSFSSYKPPDYSDKPLEFGTAFEFVPAEPAKEFTEDSAQPDIIPKEYKSIFTFESVFPDSHLDDFEDAAKSEPNAFVYHTLVFLSFLLLMLLFPILAWIFIKVRFAQEFVVLENFYHASYSPKNWALDAE